MWETSSVIIRISSGCLPSPSTHRGAPVLRPESSQTLLCHSIKPSREWSPSTARKGEKRRELAGRLSVQLEELVQDVFDQFFPFFIRNGTA
ncbi:MAG: hypothetical protein QXH12_05710 [Candidatus Caldarchaeum sp.]